jgi:hypothetical protein
MKEICGDMAILALFIRRRELQSFEISRELSSSSVSKV